MPSQCAKITTLVGAILTTIISAILIVASFGLGSLIGVPVIVFSWVGRYLAVTKISKGWTIAMIILTIIWGIFWSLPGLIEAAGYIVNLVNINKNSNLNMGT